VTAGERFACLGCGEAVRQPGDRRDDERASPPGWVGRRRGPRGRVL